MDPTQKPETKPPALKDRIADLRLRERAAGAGTRFAEGVKALQAKTPGAAADLVAKIKAAADHVKLEKLNRDSLKAGRDGLAARVETLLKPRLVDAPPPVEPRSVAQTDGARPNPRPTPISTPNGKLDIAAMKARLDAALLPKAAPLNASEQAPRQTDSAGQPTAPAMPAADVAEPVRTEPRSRWATAFDRKRSKPIDLPNETNPAEVVTRPEVPTVRTSAHVARMKPKRAMLTVGMLSTALVTGGVLHIVTTFAIPLFNVGSAFDRLKWQLEPNLMRVLPADAAGTTPAPFLSPDMRYAMCRYDITRGPVQVTAVLPDIGWSLALYTPQGDNFYAVPGLDGRIVESNFTINTASDRLLIPVPGVRRSDTDAANVTSSQREGLIVIRAPNMGSAYQGIADAALKKATCRAVERR